MSPLRTTSSFFEGKVHPERRASESKEKGGSPEDARQKVLPMLTNNMFPKRVYMSTEEWATVAPNPRQRDTEKHAARADHLKTPHPIHAFVNMAILPDGRRYKLDGHTRGYLWENNVVAAPDVLVVESWNCENIEQVKELYGIFDNVNAVETSTDRMFGAYREHDFKFKSALLSGRRIATGARFAHQILFGFKTASETNEYDILRYWSPELYLLDECGPTQVGFPSPITAAALIVFRRYGPRASDFWGRYAHDKGNKVGVERDAVQALRDRVDLMRGSRKLTSTPNIITLISVSLSAYLADRKGYMYSGGVKPLGKDAVSEFATAAKSTLRTWG